MIAPNGMAEYLLDLCINEFTNIEEHEQNPHILEFFVDYKKRFFSGYYIFLEEEDFKSKSDYEFLAKLLSKVFDFAESDKSELTNLGKSRVKENFRELVLILEKHSLEEE